MSPIIGFSENLPTKSHSFRLIPKTCLAISFARQPVPFSSSSPSSFSVTSDNGFSDPCESQSAGHQEYQTRLQSHGMQSLLCSDRQSFSSVSIGTGITDNSRDCLCQQPVNCVEFFNNFLKENMLNTCLNLSTNSFSKLDLVGFIYPITLIVAGPAESLRLLCSLWSRRLLKSPHGYNIRFIGEC